MRKITDSSKIPAHRLDWPYVQIDDDTCGWVRVPTPGQIQDAYKHAEGLDGGAKLEVQLGAVIALGWCSHTHELESTSPREVYSELHNAGWRIERIAALSNVITDLFSGSTTTEEAVEAEADFTDATQPSA